MVARERFTIAELVGRTGVPPATIHHYLRLGLLPSPYRSATNRFLYDERHALALRLVRLLRDRRRLPLATIRRVLPDLMAMEGEEAFRPEMWERVVDVRAGASSRRLPASRLLASALDAFSRRGYGDVNVDDICRAARIAKGSFYRHYRSKEDLFFGVVEAAGEEVVHAFDRSVRPGPAPEEGAAAALSAALEPRLPIFLDLLARSAQRRAGYAATARRVFGAMAFRVGQRIGADDPGSAGRALLERALALRLRAALGSDPVSSHLGPAAAST